MLRRGHVIGLAVGGFVGYLYSFDIETSLGAAGPATAGAHGGVGVRPGVLHAFGRPSPSRCGR